jgi:hypothetical protein
MLTLLHYLRKKIHFTLKCFIFFFLKKKNYFQSEKVCYVLHPNLKSFLMLPIRYLSSSYLTKIDSRVLHVEF